MRSRQPTHSPSPRGLLAGLLALVTFASAGVAMTAHGSSAVASGAAAAPGAAAVAAAAGDPDGRGRGLLIRDDHGR
jgi:hypothetical protein